MVQPRACHNTEAVVSRWRCCCCLTCDIICEAFIAKSEPLWPHRSHHSPDWLHCPEENTRRLFLYCMQMSMRLTLLQLLTNQIMICFFLQSSSKASGRGRLVATGSVRNWTPVASESVKECFERINGDLLLKLEQNQTSKDTDLDRMDECTVGYISSCMEAVMAAKACTLWSKQ